MVKCSDAAIIAPGAAASPRYWWYTLQTLSAFGHEPPAASYVGVPVGAVGSAESCPWTVVSPLGSWKSQCTPLPAMETATRPEMVTGSCPATPVRDSGSVMVNGLGVADPVGRPVSRPTHVGAPTKAGRPAAGSETMPPRRKLSQRTSAMFRTCVVKVATVGGTWLRRNIRSVPD